MCRFGPIVIITANETISDLDNYHTNHPNQFYCDFRKVLLEWTNLENARSRHPDLVIQIEGFIYVTVAPIRNVTKSATFTVTHMKNP